MAFIDELAKDNTKVIFIRVKYLDVDLVENEIFFSDHDIDIPEDLASGALIKPEPRLQKIPNFSRLIDIMDNQSIIKGSYTFNIDNQDDELTQFFQNNYFRNTDIDVFLTIKELDTFDYIQLSQGTIKSLKIDKSIKLKVDEINLYQKTLSNLNLYDYENQDDDLSDKYKPIVKGKTLNLPAVDVSTGKETFLTDIYVDTASYYLTNKFVVNTTNDAVKLREYINVGDTFFIEGYEFTLLESQPGDSILTFRVNSQIIFSNANARVAVKEESINTNTKYVISDNQTSDVLQATLASSLTKGDTYIYINEDWSFLEEGHIIYIQKAGEELKTEYFCVASYDSDLKKISIKGNKTGDTIIDRISRDMDTTYSVYFKKIQSIKNGNDVYWNKPSLTVLECGSASDINNTKDTTAELILRTDTYSENYLKFTSYVVGEVGNGDEITYIADAPSLGGETLTRTIVSNKYGSVSRWEVHYYQDIYSSTNINTIKALFDAWAIAPVPNFSTTVVGSGTAQQKLQYDPIIIEGGESNHPYLEFQFQSASDQNPEYYAIWWSRPSFPSLPPTKIKNYDYILKVDVLDSDTAEDLRDKTITAINTANSSTFPFIACEGSAVVNNILNIKQTQFQDTPPESKTNFLSASGNNFACSVSGGVQYFDTEIEDNTLILNIYKNNMATRLRKAFSGVTVTSSVYPLYERRLTVKSTDSSNIGDLDFNDKILIKFNELFDTPKMRITNVVDTNDIFINTSRSLTVVEGESFDIEVFQKVEIDELSVEYVGDKTHLADILEEIFSLYGITKYNSDDLDDLKTNHPDFLTYLKFDENLSLYKLLSDYLSSFNLISFLDKEGNIRLKFYNPYETTSNSLDWYNLIDIKYEISEFKNTDVTYKILKDLQKDSFTSVDITDTFVTAYKSVTGLEDSKELETKIMKNFLEDTYTGSLTYGDIFARKLFRKTKEVEVFGNLELLQYDIGDLLIIENYDEINPEEVYIITGIETNGTNTKLTMFTVLPKIQYNLVDENDNNIVDESDNQIVG
jgi:hypothetical protein